MLQPITVDHCRWLVADKLLIPTRHWEKKATKSAVVSLLALLSSTLGIMNTNRGLLWWGHYTHRGRKRISKAQWTQLYHALILITLIKGCNSDRLCSMCVPYIDIWIIIKWIRLYLEIPAWEYVFLNVKMKLLCHVLYILL